MTLFQLEKSKLNSCERYPRWWKHLSALPCSHPPASLESSGSQPGGDPASPGVFWQSLETSLVVATGVMWRMLLIALQCKGQPSRTKGHLGPKGSNIVGNCPVRCGVFSIPGFYSLNASSTHPHPLQVITTRNVARHYQMSPGQAK